MYTKSIDVNNNQVFLTEHTGYEVDCSALLAQKIVFYAEQGQTAWVEREPFNGRETDYDQSVVDNLFAQAEAIKLQQEQDVANQPPEPVTRITPRQARLQLIADGKLDLVDPAIASIPEDQRLIAEVEWESATFYDINNPFIQMMGNQLNINLPVFFEEASLR